MKAINQFLINRKDTGKDNLRTGDVGISASGVLAQRTGAVPITTHSAVVQACNPSTWEMEAEGPEFLGYPQLCNSQPT